MSEIDHSQLDYEYQAGYNDGYERGVAAALRTVDGLKRGLIVQASEITRLREEVAALRAAAPQAGELRRVAEIFVTRQGYHDGPHAECARLVSGLLRAPVSEPQPCRILEYDGAWKCYAHDRMWGAVVDPVEPCEGWELLRDTHVTRLRERAERAEAALLNVSVHAAHNPGASYDLIVSLLSRCGDIARAALAATRTVEPTPQSAPSGGAEQGGSDQELDK
jgi:hypothetical protein